MRFEEQNPHSLVYFGAHLTTKELASAALPEGLLRDTFIKHYKGPGFLSMQRWEGDPITHVFMGRPDPIYVAPLPRLRLSTRTEYIQEIPMDVIKVVLKEENIPVVHASSKAHVVELLAQQPEAVVERAVKLWIEKQSRSRAAAKAPQKVHPCSCAKAVQPVRASPQPLQPLART